MQILAPLGTKGNTIFNIGGCLYIACIGDRGGSCVTSCHSNKYLDKNGISTCDRCEASCVVLNGKPLRAGDKVEVFIDATVPVSACMLAYLPVYPNTCGATVPIANTEGNGAILGRISGGKPNPSPSYWDTLGYGQHLEMGTTGMGYVFVESVGTAVSLSLA